MAPVLELKIGELGEDFYDEEKAVISRLLERRNDGESRIADIYLARIGGPAAATAREKEKDKAKNRSPPKSRDESLDSGAASGHEGDKANQMNGHVESRLESMELDSSPAQPEGSESNAFVQEQHQQSEATNTAMDAVEANKPQVDEEEANAEASTGKLRSGEDTAMDIAENGQEKCKETQMENPVMTKATSKMDETKQLQDEGRVEPTSVTENTEEDTAATETQMEDQVMTEATSKMGEAKQLQDEDMAEPTSVADNAEGDTTTDLVTNSQSEKVVEAHKKEFSQTQASPIKKNEDVVKEQETKLTKARDGEDDSDNGGATKGGHNQKGPGIDSDSSSRSTARKNKAKQGKEGHEESASKRSSEGTRRPRAASRVKEKGIYNEDKLEDMLEEEDEVIRDESEHQSIDGGSNDDTNREGTDYESHDEDQKRKRRKRKATKGASGEGQVKRRGPGRPKRKTKGPPSPKRAKTPPPQRGRKPRQPSVAMIDLSWKNGGKHFPQKVSQVGAEFNATEIPETGTWEENDSSI